MKKHKSIWAYLLVVFLGALSLSTANMVLDGGFSLLNQPTYSTVERVKAGLARFGTGGYDSFVNSILPLIKSDPAGPKSTEAAGDAVLQAAKLAEASAQKAIQPVKMGVRAIKKIQEQKGTTLILSAGVSKAEKKAIKVDPQNPVLLVRIPVGASGLAWFGMLFSLLMLFNSRLVFSNGFTLTILPNLLKISWSMSVLYVFLTCFVGSLDRLTGQIEVWSHEFMLALIALMLTGAPILTALLHPRLWPFEGPAIGDATADEPDEEDNPAQTHPPHCQNPAHLKVVG